MSTTDKDSMKERCVGQELKTASSESPRRDSVYNRCDSHKNLSGNSSRRDSLAIARQDSDSRNFFYT